MEYMITKEIAGNGQCAEKYLQMFKALITRKVSTVGQQENAYKLNIN